MRKPESGLTLLEVIIASAILSAVVMMAMAVLYSSSHTANTGSLASELEQRGNRLLSNLHDELSTAQFASATFTTPVLGILPSYLNTAIVYQVSGPSTGNSTGAMTTPFGYMKPQSNTFDSTLACILRFEADTVYQESVAATTIATQAAGWTLPALPYPPLANPTPSFLPSQILKVDVNGNGNQTDVFVSGRIMKYIVNSVGSVLSREQLDGDVILRVSGSGAGQFNGDVDGDGKADLLFSFTNAAGVPDNTLTGTTASGLLVNVWHGRPDDTGKGFMLKNNRFLLHFRK